MSWWDIENGGVLGDEAADIFVMCVSGLAGADEPNPSTRDVLEAFTAAVRSRAGALSGDASLFRVVARFVDGTSVVATGGGRVDEEMTAQFTEAIDDVGEAYQERWGRMPTVAELVETLSFVLCAEPERYLDVPADAEIESIHFE